MSTFLDTSVIMSAINDGEPHHAWSVAKIEERRAEGPLVISDLVYSELAAGMTSREETDAVIEEWAIERLRNSDDVLFNAGQAGHPHQRGRGALIAAQDSILLGGGGPEADFGWLSRKTPSPDAAIPWRPAARGRSGGQYCRRGWRV